MSIADQRKRLAKVEARRRRRRKIDDGPIDTLDLARRTCWLLRCAANGEGGPELLAAAVRISSLLSGAPRLTPEEMGAARLARFKATLKRVV